MSVSVSGCDPEQILDIADQAARRGITPIEALISGTSHALKRGEALLAVAGGGQIRQGSGPLTADGACDARWSHGAILARRGPDPQKWSTVEGRPPGGMRPLRNHARQPILLPDLLDALGELRRPNLGRSDASYGLQANHCGQWICCLKAFGGRIAAEIQCFISSTGQKEAASHPWVVRQRPPSVEQI